MLSRQHIATCGIHCELCKAYQRDKNNCCGCNTDKANKPKYCITCPIKNCQELIISEIKYCYVCSKFPYQRLKHLDKRYRLKYGMSLISNLNTIKEQGINKFLLAQIIKWQCRNCGCLYTVHKSTCFHCESINPYFAIPLLA